MSRAYPWALVILATSGCASAVDRFTVHRVVERGMEVPDVDKVCALGAALAHPLAAASGKKHPPHQALVIAELTSATCEEDEAWESELDMMRATHNLVSLGDARAAEIQDARLRAQRAHALAATRFDRAFLHLEAAYGDVGEGCPKLGHDDEVVYLVGLVAGMLGVLNDRSSGGMASVPLDIVGKVGRGATCLSDETWWNVPSALQAAARAIIPGSAPEGVDPWADLDRAATAGETSGTRVARALEILVLANADRQADLERAIRAHAASMAQTPQAPDWALLDEYSRLVGLHQSDLIWTQATGHRTASYGALPSDAVDSAAPPDPFADETPLTPTGDTP